MPYRVLLSILCLLCLTFSHGAQNTAKKIRKNEQKLQNHLLEGEIQKALRRIHVLEKEYQRHYQKRKKLAKLKLWKAQVLAAQLQEPMEIEKVLKQALKETNTIYGEKSKQVFEAYLIACKVSIKEKNLLKAKLYLDKCEELSNFVSVSSSKKLDLQLIRLTLWDQEGFYTESLARISATEKKKNRWSLSQSALLVSYKINAMVSRGDYKKALKIISSQIKWAKSKGLGGSTFMVDLLYLRGKCHRELDLPDEAMIAFEAAHSIALKTNYGFGYMPTITTLDELTSKLSNIYMHLSFFNNELKINKRFAKAVEKNIGVSKIMLLNNKLNEIKLYINNGEYHDAKLEFENLAGKINKEHTSFIILSKYLEIKFDIYDFEGNYKQAQNTVEEVIVLYDSIFESDSPVLHTWKLIKAELQFMLTDELVDAYNTFHESFTKHLDKEFLPSHVFHIHYSNILIGFMLELGHLKEAETLSRKTLNQVTSYYEPEDIIVARQYNTHASLQFRLGNIVQTRTNLDRATKYNQLGDSFKILVNVNILEGEYKDARKNLNRALEILEIDDLSSSEHVNFATLSMHYGYYDEVEYDLNEAVRGTKSLFGTESRFLIPIYNKYIELYLMQGNFRLVDKYCNYSLEISKRVYGEKSIQFSEALILQGKYYTEIGNYEKAVSNYLQALEIQNKDYPSENIHIANTLQLLALSDYKLHKNKQTEYLLRKSKKIVAIKAGKQNNYYADILYNMAAFYIETNKLDKAHSYIDEATKIWQNYDLKLKKSEKYAKLKSLSGLLNFRQRNYKRAERDYLASEKFYVNTFGETHPKSLHVKSQLAKIYYLQGAIDESINTIRETTKEYLKYIKNFNFLSEKERTAYWNVIKDDFEFFKSVAFDHYTDKPELCGDVYNDLLITKGLLLNSAKQLRHAISSSSDPVIKEDFENWQDKRQELVNLQFSQRKDNKSERERQIKVLTKEVEQLEKNLNAFEGFNQNKNRKRSWQDVRDALKHNEYAIEITRYRYFNHDFSDSVIYAALIIDRKTLNHPRLVLFPDGKMMETKHYSYYNNTAKNNIENKKSHDVFWKPIENKLKRNCKVYLSSEGIYTQINLEILPKNGQYVFDKFTIIPVTNTADILIRKKHNNTDNSIAVFADVSFYARYSVASRRDIQSLAGTIKEGRFIKNIASKKGWKADLFTKLEASEEKLKSLENPGMLHIASHGYFKETKKNQTKSELVYSGTTLTEDPMLNSGILLKGSGDYFETGKFIGDDGILTAKEASNLHLKNTFVVLSACETGKGKIEIGEGVLGLQRSFMVAGARKIIMSLFRVSDKITTEFMQLFYTHYLGGKSDRESFNLAKMEIRKKFKSPIYWGAFVMIGN